MEKLVELTKKLGWTKPPICLEVEPEAEEMAKLMLVDVEVTALDKNVFLFSFNHEVDMRRVQVHGLPLNRQNEANLKKIGAMMGKVLDVDLVGRGGDGWKRFIKGAGIYGKWLKAENPEFQPGIDLKSLKNSDVAECGTIGGKMAARGEAGVIRGFSEGLGTQRIGKKGHKGSGQGASLKKLACARIDSTPALRGTAATEGESSVYSILGAGRAPTVKAIKALARSESPDVLFLSKTKINSPKVDRLKRSLGFADSFCLDCVGRAGGLALFWKLGVDLEVIFANRFVMAALWLLLGDLNSISDTSEKQGGSSKGAISSQNFRSFVENVGAIDLGFSGVRHLTAPNSDHNPILLDTHVEVEKGSKPFPFEAMWVKDESSSEVVEKAWSINVEGSQNFVLGKKFQTVRRDFIYWNKMVFGNAKVRIKAIKDQIKAIQDLDPSRENLDMEAALNVKLNEWLEREEAKWLQKSRELWSSSLLIRKFLPTLRAWSLLVFLRRKNNEISRIPDAAEIKGGAQEIVHNFKKSKRKKGSIGFKLDFHKAYDCLEWDFIIKVLGALGFNQNVSNLIFQSISSVRFTLLLNGCKSTSFSSSRGVKVFPRAPTITKLFYADDVLLLCGAKISEVESLMGFNKANIAKFAWWILSGRDSFCVKVLRAKYKVDSKWLQARPAVSASFSWRGLEGVRSHLSKGACLLVGNEAFRSLSVADLMSPNKRSWDVNKLQLLFNEESMKAIQNIPRWECDQEDKWIWLKSDSVKSMYKVVAPLEPALHQSPLMGKNWKLRIHDSLCGGCVESVTHLFWDCSFARALWFGCIWGIRSDIIPVHSPMNLVENLLAPPPKLHISDKDNFVLYGALILDYLAVSIWRKIQRWMKLLES
uniref:Reverse transcriptase zinc-binding domain-containing protein n=1 Tax=Fagus sylvatica TaxID=28930 RepID=A0A2N9J510_FAGSY